MESPKGEITKLVEAGFHEGVGYTTNILKVLSTKTIHQDFATNRILCEAISIIADTIEITAKELRTCQTTQTSQLSG